MGEAVATEVVISRARRRVGEGAPSETSGAVAGFDGGPASLAKADVPGLLLEAPLAFRRRSMGAGVGAWAAGCLRLDARELTFRKWTSRQVERRFVGELKDVGIEDAGVNFGPWSMSVLRVDGDGFVCGRRGDLALWVRVIESLRAGTPVSRLLEHAGEVRGAAQIAEAVSVATAEHEALMADRANRGPLWRGEMPEEMRAIELCGHNRLL